MWWESLITIDDELRGKGWEGRERGRISDGVLFETRTQALRKQETNLQCQKACLKIREGKRGDQSKRAVSKEKERIADERSARRPSSMFCDYALSVMNETYHG